MGSRPVMAIGRVVVLLFSALLVVTPVGALDPAKRITEFGLDWWESKDGLPQNSVYAILQTRDGYLWLGTQEGLVRFDGLRFTVFDKSNTPQMASASVRALLEARDGSLWVGTDGGGLLRRKDAVFRSYAIRDGLPADVVTQLAEDSRGRLFVATAGGLAELRDERFHVYSTRNGLPGDQVNTLHFDRGGLLWIGTDFGLARLAQGRFSTYTTRDGLASDRVTALAEDAEGRLWVGTNRGLSLRDGNRFAPVSDGQPGDHIRSLYLDRRGA